MPTHVQASQGSVLRLNGKGQAVQPMPLVLTCPACGVLGTFVPTCVSDVHGVAMVFGQRMCPSLTCRAHVFVWWPGNVPAGTENTVSTWPPARIPLDARGLPGEVVAALNEAISCHAHHCYRASAVMVRRAFEVLCDLREAKGKNLNDRLDALAAESLLPPKLREGLHALRLLGNDAVHVTSKTYDSIGAMEVALAIDVAKAVLASLYQNDDLVGRLQALQKP